jgi:hypothetical protein
MRKFLAAACVAIFLMFSSGGTSTVIADDEQITKRSCTIDHKLFPQQAMRNAYAREFIKHLKAKGLKVYGQAQDRMGGFILFYDSLQGCATLISNSNVSAYWIITHEDGWRLYKSGVKSGDIQE